METLICFLRVFFGFGLSACVISFSLLLCYLVEYLFVLLFDSIEFPECEACYLESLAFEDRQPGKSFDHVLQYLWFCCIRIIPPHHACSRRILSYVLSSIMR